MTARTALFASLALGATACSGGGGGGADDTDVGAELAGTYETVSYEKAVDCTTYEAGLGPSHYKLVDEGAELWLHECTSASDCDTFELNRLAADGEAWLDVETWTVNPSEGDGCEHNARRTKLEVTPSGARINVRRVTEFIGEAGLTDQSACEAHLESFEPAFDTNPLDCVKIVLSKLEDAPETD